MEIKTATDWLNSLEAPVTVVGNGPLWGFREPARGSVIRFNNFVLNGESGVRATHWVVCGNADIAARPFACALVPWRPFGDLTQRTEAFTARTGTPVLCTETNDHILRWFPDAEKDGVKTPSTGFCLLAWLWANGLRPKIAGFNGLRSGHYWVPQHQHCHETTRDRELEIIGEMAQPPARAAGKQRADVLIGICASHMHPLRRKIVRETWRRRVPAGMEALFFLGNGPETREPGLVQLLAPDGYHELPHKVRAFFRYALERFDFDYLFKCDDDTYLCPERLRHLTSAGADYTGSTELESLGYCHGGAGYLLSHRAVRLLVEAPTPRETAEDRWVGNTLRAAGIRPRRSPFLCGERHTLPRPDNAQITAHHIHPDLMLVVDHGFSRPGATDIVATFTTTLLAPEHRLTLLRNGAVLGENGHYPARWRELRGGEKLALDWFGDPETPPSREVLTRTDFGFVGKTICLELNERPKCLSPTVKSKQPKKAEAEVFFISFYTDGNGYEMEAEGLRQTLEAFGLEHRIVGVPPLASWQAATQYKAEFILSQFGPGRPMVWLDADARVRREPELFARLRCDFAAHYRDGHELLASTLYFGGTPKSQELIQRWVARNAAQPQAPLGDQRNLQEVVEEMKNEIIIHRLPAPYALIFDTMGEQGPPVIEQMQASRRLKR